ncbi:hypothetical protein H696_03978 [Fonticula alba]|uniref:Uncharacterized protein n=1 Tax=Fonticula alba TaxID=691883 RepID=A0A058Z626_FONAL|nr:hypothetical protein H696_03978 [Fonticula alba]KCV69556.1 hypothetical protein H696_03978 [Fonticula alba]|eukprot:XP_009496121.1 hypothetical protein H696_03978 [Fonticula alba]
MLSHRSRSTPWHPGGRRGRGTVAGRVVLTDGVNMLGGWLLLPERETVRTDAGHLVARRPKLVRTGRMELYIGGVLVHRTARVRLALIDTSTGIRLSALEGGTGGRAEEGSCPTTVFDSNCPGAQLPPPPKDLSPLFRGPASGGPGPHGRASARSARSATPGAAGPLAGSPTGAGAGMSAAAGPGPSVPAGAGGGATTLAALNGPRLRHARSSLKRSWHLHVPRRYDMDKDAQGAVARCAPVMAPPLAPVRLDASNRDRMVFAASRDIYQSARAGTGPGSAMSRGLIAGDPFSRAMPGPGQPGGGPDAGLIGPGGSGFQAAIETTVVDRLTGELRTLELNSPACVAAISMGLQGQEPAVPLRIGTWPEAIPLPLDVLRRATLAAGGTHLDPNPVRVDIIITVKDRPLSSWRRRDTRASGLPGPPGARAPGAPKVGPQVVPLLGDDGAPVPGRQVAGSGAALFRQPQKPSRAAALRGRFSRQRQIWSGSFELGAFLASCKKAPPGSLMASDRPPVAGATRHPGARLSPEQPGNHAFTRWIPLRLEQDNVAAARAGADAPQPEAAAAGPGAGPGPATGAALSGRQRRRHTSEAALMHHAVESGALGVPTDGARPYSNAEIHRILKAAHTTDTIEALGFSQGSWMASGAVGDLPEARLMVSFHLENAIDVSQDNSLALIGMDRLQARLSTRGGGGGGGSHDGPAAQARIPVVLRLPVLANEPGWNAVSLDAMLARSPVQALPMSAGGQWSSRSPGVPSPAGGSPPGSPPAWTDLSWDPTAGLEDISLPPAGRPGRAAHNGGHDNDDDDDDDDNSSWTSQSDRDRAEEERAVLAYFETLRTEQAARHRVALARQQASQAPGSPPATGAVSFAPSPEVLYLGSPPPPSRAPPLPSTFYGARHGELVRSPSAGSVGSTSSRAFRWRRRSPG